MKTEQINNATLTVILGGKITPQEFAKLDFDKKLSRLRSVPIGNKMELITEDPDGRKLTQALSPQEYYLFIKDIGENDSLPLLSYASPAQCAFTLDMELWDKWEFSVEKAFRWIEHLLACSEEEAMRLLTNLDPELLQLFLLEEIEVGADTGEMSTDAERLGNWDHTFDNIYFITFRNDKHSRLTGALLDIVYRLDHQFYLDLMEGCRGALKHEIEEQCYQFRNARLADLGFPEYEQAIEIYVPIKPDHYSPSEPKIALEASEIHEVFFPAVVDSESLLGYCLAHAQSASLKQEMEALINSALIAEHGGLPDEDSMGSTLTRVHGWLNIALEYLSGASPERAVDIMKTERLKRLFQLGCGIVQEIATEARTMESSDYATGKALRGFSSRHPRFYRGLDPDHTDGYREFRKMDDIRNAVKFLAMIKG